MCMSTIFSNRRNLNIVKVGKGSQEGQTRLRREGGTEQNARNYNKAHQKSFET